MNDDESRGKRILAKRVILAWLLVTFAAMATIGSGAVPVSHLDAMTGAYLTFTLAACGLAAALLGLDAAGAQIIPALKGTR